MKLLLDEFYIGYISAINDLSGIGRCSLSVALPIISALKVQCCPFPTSILSSQTGYPKFTFLDLTNEMTNYYKVWKDLNVNFSFPDVEIEDENNFAPLKYGAVIGANLICTGHWLS